MATVYLAHDLKHDRDVAIKVLHPDLGAVLGSERFLSEIKTTAKLQHPHILPLLDSGEAEGLLFYVMPVVTGETLRARLTRERQLPIEDAVRIAREAASALDYAHRHGVIHRDVKPENILLHDGQALVADFGIALAVETAGGERMTQTGLSLGTPQYMSPEQAMGERVIDARSDIYSLGAVTYEMLAGDPPFTGSSVQAIVAKIMSAEATELQSLRKTVPSYLSDAVHTALQKLPADRFASAHAFGEAVAGSSASAQLRRPRSGSPGASLRGRAISQRAAVLTLAVLSMAALAWGAWEWALLRRASPDPVLRFTVDFARSVGAIIRSGNGAMVALSPDGLSIAFAGDNPQGSRSIFVQRLDALTATPLQGTDGATQPVFSPDGKWIAYWSAQRLQKVAVRGGAPQLIAETPLPTGLTWSPHGEIVFSDNSRLFVIDANGGGRRLLAPLDSAHGEQLQLVPLALADGEHVLYSSWGSGGLESVRIGIASLTARTSHRVETDFQATSVVGMVDGNVIFANGTSTLLAVPLDLAKERVTGSPAPVVTDVAMGSRGSAKAALSASGSLMYLSGTRDSRLVLANAQGATALAMDSRAYGYPRYSPDGKRLAVTISGGTTRDVSLYDMASRTLTRLSSGGTVNERPEWSPDGARVLFRSQHDTRSSIWWRPVDMSAPPSSLLASDRAGFFEAVMTPDGAHVVYQVDTAGPDVEYRALRGDTTPRAIAVSRATEQMPRVSPDGRWVVFTTDESGLEQVVVQPFPGPGPRVQVSTMGGTEPVWTRDGKRIFYRNRGKFVEVFVATRPGFSVMSRRDFMDDDYLAADSPHANYDVSPDGKQLLVVQGDQERMIVVHNWQAEVREHLRSERTP
jgi:Tol biopolymer transport system component